MFFGVELILREFSVDALFTVMLSAMLADVTARPFLGSGPFLSGFPPGIVLHHPQNYLLVALLAVLAALIGVGFKNVLYKIEDFCDRAWRGRPEWARPAAGGVVLGLLLLAVPQLYGVGYPVMYQAVGGHYVLWFLIVLAAGKMIATSLTIGIGGSGGVFAPSLFIGATSGMAFGEIARHLLGPAAGQPALYAVVAMGAVFTAAARAPLTSLASVVEMTGDFALTLPVMLAVAIATAVSRALSYGTIYTTKLLRRGTDIDRVTPWRALQDLKVADAMRALPEPLAAAGHGNGADGQHAPTAAGLPGPVTYRRDPQVLFAGESLAQALRQLVIYGRDGLPVLSDDNQRVQGWVTNNRTELFPLPSLGKMRRQKLHQHFDPRGARAAGRHHQMHRAFGLLPALQDHLDLAGRDGVADDELRQVGDAEARDQRGQHRLTIVDAQRPRGPYIRLLALGIGVVPDIRRREIGIGKAPVLRQMHRMGRASILLEISRCSDCVTRHRAQPSRDQRGVRQAGDPQARVKTLADQVDHGVAEMQIDRDVGVCLQKLRQDRRDDLDAEGHGHREPDQAAGRDRLRQRLVFRGLAIREEARGALRQFLSGIGQGQPPRGAVEQPCAEPALQPGDCFRDRGLGERQFGRGRRERSQLHDFRENRQRLEIREVRHQS